MELEELIRSNANLEDYLKEYGDNSKFLYHYFAQNLDRILSNNYYIYANKLDITNLINLAELIVSKSINYDILNRVCDTMMNKVVDDSLVEDFIDRNETKIDFNQINNYFIKMHHYRKNPLKAIEKNADNIIYVGEVNKKEFAYIIEKLKSSNYIFGVLNRDFLERNVYNNYDNFLYFINNAQCEGIITDELLKCLNNFTPNELHDCYNKCNNEIYKKAIVKMNNNQNYNIDSIIKEENIYLLYKDNKVQILDMLNKLKAINYSKDVILQMERVDMNFIEEAYQIIGDRLKISPIMNQEGIKLHGNDWEYPIYDVDKIRKSETILDLYTKTTDDKLDKDGEIKSLSPLEKYVAAYILTTKFSPYKEEDNNMVDYHTSRSVYEFVDNQSDRRIVCVGYVHLLREFLYRMGLTDTIRWDVHSETEALRSKSSGDNHARMMIHLVDPKYGIDGVYMSDPTWDQRFDQFKHNHMLMTKDEAKTIDKDFKDEDLHYDKLDEVGKSLGIQNVQELFNKPISNETILKAYLSVEHFLDKNMKMVKDDNEYDILDYCEMAQRLGFDKIVREKQEEMFKQVMKMKLSDIVQYPSLMNIFQNNLASILERETNMDMIELMQNEKTNELCVNICLNPKEIDIEKLNEEYKYRVINRKLIEIPVYVMQDKPIMEQYFDIIDSINEFNNKVYNNSLENEENRVK